MFESPLASDRVDLSPGFLDYCQKLADTVILAQSKEDQESEFIRISEEIDKEFGKQVFLLCLWNCFY